jgi:exopolysaccharide biosynthesis polyprenyl glycosylphosphotransferase
MEVAAVEEMTPTAVERSVLRTRATEIAVTSHLSGTELRPIAWSLEGSPVNLLVAPAVTDVAGPRMTIRPVAGLPLLYVDEPQLRGPQMLAKSVIDRVTALIILIIFLPVLVAIAVLVKLSSPGPVLFRQTRVGKESAPFTLLKFRTMYQDADRDPEIIALNEADGPLFKIQKDPRVTPIGRLLRRFSLDELPQLWHVLRGDMSLVGPRPPLPNEVEEYDDHVHRRFKVKPGMTGLWQVSGRADLPWEEAVRLDLHYVDHWSITMDFIILAKTLTAVIRGRGAY